MSDINPEGFYRHPDPLCVCGPLYTYGGHIEPGGYAEDCPIHGNPKVFYDEVDRLRAGIEQIADIFDPIDYDELAGDAVHEALALLDHAVADIRAQIQETR